MIEEWLINFKNGWIEKDINSVINLFADDVEYWETPFKKLESKADLKKEWLEIEKQENLAISTNLYNSEGIKHTVIWRIAYNKNNTEKQQVWSGVYLIELNNKGLCSYFQQVGEKDDTA